MKPNYCSGGTFASGRISTSGLSSRGSSSSSSSSIYKDNNNGNNEKINLGEGRQQQHQLNRRGSKSLNYSLSSSTTPSSSPAFIVYRSAKYISPHARLLQTVRSYAKFYLVLPIALFANRCKDAFYQIFGLLLLLALSPLWMLMIIGLFVFRRLRNLLIKRLHPNLVQLDDYNSQLSPTSTPTESHGIVNSIIWIKGKIDANAIRQRFKLLFTENPRIYDFLRLKPVTKFGAKLWEHSSDFQLENHIVEAPKTFHNCPLVDEPLKELYRSGPNNKSILQKYVSYCISLPMDCTAPPWKIHIVSYISRDDGLREKTCLVIKMHVALIKNGEVKEALHELFLNSGQSSNEPNDGDVELLQASQSSVEVDDLKGQTLDFYSVMALIKKNEVWERLKNLWQLQQKNVTIWLNLRMKQLEFHSKTAVVSIIFIDIKHALKRLIASCEKLLNKAFTAVVCFIIRVITIIQAVASMPMIILMSLIRKRHFKKLGLQNHPVPGKKLVSWSDLIHGDLAVEICKKLGTNSPENVILMTCQYALRDYYQQNNLPIPKVGFIVGNAGNALCPSRAMKHIRMSSRQDSYGGYAKASELLRLEDKLQNFPKWKILGMAYISRFSHLFLPSPLALKLQQSVIATYPFLFTHVNLKSDSIMNCGQDLLPIQQLYGELVEDFTFWPLPPLSDLGISITLVRCTGKTRLFVLSPFQSMDTILTHRCNQYLIKLAEDVGVEKSRIPYSRRSSPSSSNCSTPQSLSSCINPIDNLIGFKPSLRRSESQSLNSANY